MYEVLTLWMRYFFALLALVFVVRSWMITVRDNRRARMIRAWLPETGTIGEWLVLCGGTQVRKGTRFPILNEGMIGSSRRADVRVVHPDVQSEHAYFSATPEGICVCPAQDTSAMVESHLGGVYHPVDGSLAMTDGDVLVLGKLRLLLTLFDLRASRHPLAIPDVSDETEDEASNMERLNLFFDTAESQDTYRQNNGTGRIRKLVTLKHDTKGKKPTRKDGDELEILWQNDRDRTRKR